MQVFTIATEDCKTSCNALQQNTRNMHGLQSSRGAGCAVIRKEISRTQAIQIAHMQAICQRDHASWEKKRLRWALRGRNTSISAQVCLFSRCISGKIKNELMLVLDLTAFAASGLRAGLKRPVHLRLIIYDHLSCSDEADYHGLRKK